MSVFQAYAEKFFDKETFVTQVSNVFNLAADVMGDESDEDAVLKKMILNKICSEESYQICLQLFVETTQEVYSEEELQVLMDFYEKNPWVRQKACQSAALQQARQNQALQPIMAELEAEIQEAYGGPYMNG